CGSCAECASGNQQICDRQFQPGATHWGSFAEFVAVDYAETNLVALPQDLSSVHAAALGCRFATAFRALLRQGNVRTGQWVAVYGCGGSPATCASSIACLRKRGRHVQVGLMPPAQGMPRIPMDRVIGAELQIIG